MISNDFPRRWRKSSFESPRSFTFLNHTITIKDSWFPIGASPLWSFNLHCFDFLAQQETDPKLLRDLIEKWLEEVPMRHHWGWHPYPTSLRVCNWIWFYSEHEDLFKPDFNVRFLDSLYDQLFHIRGNLEFQTLGNHLIENIKALIVGGCFFNEEPLVRRGIRLLNRELKEQVLDDGAHFERTPSYHLIVLEDFLAIFNALSQTKRAIPPKLRNTIVSMSKYADTLFHNEQFPGLSDSSQEIPPPWTLLREKIGESLEIPPRDIQPLTHFKDSGLIVYHGDGISLFFDAGKIGPDYLPGHAHNDTLSVLLFYKGKPLLTDSGVYEYTEGKWRDYFRSAKAHNVPFINNEEPNDIWKAFRVGYRGHPYNVKINGLRFSASDSAYERIGVKWNRSVEILNDDKEIVITDNFVNSRNMMPIEWNFHFAPGLTGNGDKTFQIDGEGVSLGFEMKGEGVTGEVSTSWYSKEFGLKEERLCLKGKAQLPSGSSEYTFSLKLD